MGAEQRSVDRMAGHELLGLGGERFGLFLEFGRFGLGQQGPDPLEVANIHFSVPVPPGKCGIEGGGATPLGRRRAELRDIGEVMQHDQQLEGGSQHATAVETVLLSQVHQMIHRRAPSHDGIDLVELSQP